jgi:hypothetical protein
MIWLWQVMGKGHEAAIEAHSSSGLGHRPLKAEITGSNPVCATNRSPLNSDEWKALTPMATLEERVQALEQEIVARKKAEELLTIAVRALVSKEAFEKLQDTVEKLQDTIEKSQEQNGKLFDIINIHNAFINQQFAELREKVEVQVEGKIVGMQTEMRQRFAEQDGKITGLDGKITGVQTEMRQRFAEQDGKITSVQTTQTEQTTLLQQILARLPEKP